jgi:glutamate--cysteine ligase regulatory subunit
MADCCVMPHKLIAYCREQGIQLVTHNDACPPLDEQALAHLWRTQSNMLKTQIQPLWILKFSTMLQSRGILADKGYILCATLSTDRN